PLSHFSYI
ncbi:hypothetical protein N499_0318B, partial [Wolbachia pipientis wVitA]